MATLPYSRNGETKNLPVGFSWTTMFFGFIPTMMRKNWGVMWILIFVDLAALYSTVFIYKGHDYALSAAIFRALAAALRNVELHKCAVRDGWECVNHGK
jgi:hypothetical protein